MATKTKRTSKASKKAIPTVDLIPSLIASQQAARASAVELSDAVDAVSSRMLSQNRALLKKALSYAEYGEREMRRQRAKRHRRNAMFLMIAEFFFILCGIGTCVLLFTLM
jgi:uncharacterized membrane protein